MNGGLDFGSYAQLTKSLTVGRPKRAGEVHEDDDDDDKAEGKYEMFRNMSSNTIWKDYCSLLKVVNREGAVENGNDNDGEQGCVQEAKGQQETF